MAMAQWLGRRRTSHQQTPGAAQRTCQRPGTGGGSMSHQVIRLNVMERETDLVVLILMRWQGGVLLGCWFVVALLLVEMLVVWLVLGSFCFLVGFERVILWDLVIG